VIRDQIRSLGPWTAGEKGVLAVFLSAAFLWITRENIVLGDFIVPGWAGLLGLEGIHDGTVAILAAVVLFMVPADRKKGEFLIDWEWAKKLPWEVLLLFGGGFALAESFHVTGLASWLGQGFGFLQGMPVFALILCLSLSVTFLSELMSNTAQTTMMMPVLAAASATLGAHPHLLMVPATFAASLAFMMPVGTPPNAIVFGSGYLTIAQMARTGVVLNILAALWITLITLTLGTKVFGF
jgi:sodium-dependent dicarboxylate transporter 2/3/5